VNPEKTSPVVTMDREKSQPSDAAQRLSLSREQLMPSQDQLPSGGVVPFVPNAPISVEAELCAALDRARAELSAPALRRLLLSALADLG
jgi:hypothetical protein